MTSLVFDIETDGLYDDVTRCWCICIRGLDAGSTERYFDTGYGDDDKGLAVRSHRHGDISDALAKLRQAERIIGHNIISYDLPVLRKLFGFEYEGSVVDTLVLSRLFKPDRPGGHSLREWGIRLGRHKGDYEDWAGGLTHEMLEYCARDVDVNLAVYKELKEEIKGQRWGESIEIEHQVAEIISQQEINGVLFDVDLANETLSTIEQEVESIDGLLSSILPTYVTPKGVYVSSPYTKAGVLTARARKILGDSANVLGPFQGIEFRDVDLNSQHQIKKWLLEIGWSPTEFTLKGGPKLTEDSFDSLSDRNLGTLLKVRMQHKHRAGQINGWLDNVRGDGRISAGANPLGTPTARMRHSRVVNVPAAATYPKDHELAGHLHWFSDRTLQQSVLWGTEMRAMFIAPEGFDIVGHDASGLELRMLAHYMNDPEYTEVLLNGDIHSYNQELAGLYTRSAAKTFIYAFIYGAGDAKLGSIVEGGEDEGAELRRRFLSANPKLSKLITKAKRAARERGYLVGLDGRRIWLRRDERGRVAEHKALNTLLQCAGAVVMKKSMIILNDSATDNKLDFLKVIDMHDEGQAQVWKPHSQTYAELAVDSVVQAGVHFNLNVPLAAEAKIGNNWAETH